LSHGDGGHEIAVVSGMSAVKVYGADWCSMTTRTREHPRSVGVEYDYIDIEKERETRQWVKEQNGGKEQKPTVQIHDPVLAEPSNGELDRELAAAGLRE
jgi:glutaredoxin